MISIKYPVSGKDFVNRVELLRNIHKIYPVDNVALVGPRRIGKSSVAEQFLETLTHDNTVKFRFNVQRNIGTPGKFAMRLLRSFMFAYYQCLNIESDLGTEDIVVNPRILMDISDRLNSKTLLNLSRFIISYYPPVPE